MNDKFLFYSKSADKKPGKGSGEEKNTDIVYDELESYKDWRKTLSNFYISPFKLDDENWNSVEHYFHAVKFRDDKKPGNNYDYYKSFSLDSNSPWSREAFLSKQAGKAGRVSETTGKVFDKTIDGVKIPKNVKMRDDFYSKKIPSILQRLAMFAKFTQNPYLKKVLLATKEAELWHFVGRGSPNIKVEELMIVRNCIRKYDNIYDLNEISKFPTDAITKTLNADNSNTFIPEYISYVSVPELSNEEKLNIFSNVLNF
jgi:predicted NAD-dependent protein-ADP-ribosyltransferase YbiA (DUF1768 family)